MVVLSSDLIRSYCHQTTTFFRGKTYYHAGAVLELNFHEERNVFSALVEGTMDYSVLVNFDLYGNLLSTSCDCPAYYSYSGPCKHIVASLFAILENKKLYGNSKAMAEKLTQDIFNYFTHKTESFPEKELNIQWMYRLLHNNHSYSVRPRSYVPSLSFKIGEKRLYMVRNVMNLVEAIAKKKYLNFGKHFAYDPEIHVFKKEDQPIMELLIEAYEMDKFSTSPNSSQKKSMFAGGEMKLTESLSKKVLELLKGQDFKFNIESQGLWEVNILEEDLPLTFSLSRKDKDMVLSLKTGKHPIPLAADGSFFFYSGNIYNLSLEQRHNFLPFYQSLESNKNSLLVPEKYKERFASELFPPLKKAGTLQIEESLSEDFYRENLEAEVYLDSARGGIKAELVFVYGERKINPIGDEEEKEETNGRILLRDIQRERNIMSLFEEGEFKVKGKEMHLEEDEAIYKFVYYILPRVQELCTVYYSDAFSKFKIKQPAFKGKIGINIVSNVLEFEFDIEGVSREELFEVFSSLREKKKYHRLKNGAFLPLDSEDLRSAGEIVEGLELKKKDFKGDKLTLPLHRALYFDQLIEEKKFKSLKKNMSFKELVQTIKEPEDLDYKLPGNLEDVVRDYQKTGFRWLKALSSYGFGGILADDMGLGKTLQAIAFLWSLKEEKPELSLVVAPTSLIFNWQSELEKFAPTLKGLVVSGTKKERSALIEKAGEYDIIITSYPLLRRDIEEYKEWKFNCCILDEAQYIKNPSSLTAKAAKIISADHLFALTGTPMQNSLTELWSIFDCVMPGYLSSYNKFVKRYAKTVEKEGDNKLSQELAKKVQPFILRRLKGDVLTELPPKIEHKIVSELTREQKKLYLAYLEGLRKATAAELKGGNFDKSRIKILAGLTRLRQLCCHPSLFIENYKGESGKLIQLKDVLAETMGSGHRVLLFSQFTGMLNIIRNLLEKEDYSYFYLDGSVKASLRLEMVQEFNKGSKDIFLISLKAGGTGLNLTGADTVIHYDLWWNPAVEDQASDRAHRLGQKKVVQVLKMISMGTIEEKIYDLQQHKKKLIDRVIQPGETFFSSLKEEEIREILEL